MGAGRLAAMIAVAMALLGFFGFVILRVTAPQMITLYTDLSYDDASGVMKELDRQGIPYELRNDGSIIMVPKDKVTRLRMKLAESGLPKGGGVGYEIFDKSDTLGSTSFVQNVNHLRALEGELARTIKSIDRIQAVRVHRQLGQLRSLFHRVESRIAAENAAVGRAVRRLAQKLDSIDHEIGSLHERARLLLDELDAKTAAIANRRLFTLSILTACLLPPTLVTGFFGMNTKDLPFQNTDGGTWLALLVAFASGAISYWALRRMRAF